MNDHWDCPSCGRPTPPEFDVECHCGMMSSHHVSVRELCKRLRESQQRESALIVRNKKLEDEVNEQARLLGMSAERECDLRGELERERAIADRLHGVLDSLDFRLAFVEDKANGSISEDITKMRSIIFPALNAWKEARGE